MFDQRYDMEGNYQVTRGQDAPDGYVEIDPDDLEMYEGYSEDGEDELMMEPFRLERNRWEHERVVEGLKAMTDRYTMIYLYALYAV